MKKALCALGILLFASSAPTQQNNGTTVAGVNPLVIQVSGNHLVDGAGHTIRLTGVNVPFTNDCSLSPGHNPLNAAEAATLATWNINAVRLDMDEYCWLANSAVPQSTIVNFVNALHANGIYAILDLHYFGPTSATNTQGNAMCDAANASNFWNSIASTFQNDHAVVFETCNEPNQITWATWLSGGSVTSTNCRGCDGTYTAVGQQSMVTTIRNAGASSQPIMLDCINFAQDCSQFVANLPNDPSHALMGATHIYQFFGCSTTSCLGGNVNPILAAGIPIMISEFGETDGGTANITAYMNFADASSPALGYTIWAWFTTTGGGVLDLITNYNGTATSPYGTTFKAHTAQIQ